MNTSATGGYLTPVGAAQEQDDNLDDIFQSLIVGVTGLPGTMVRPRWQPTPAQQPPAATNWCSIGVTSVERDDYVFIQHNGAANGGLGQDTLTRYETLIVLVTFYGPNGDGYASTFRDGMAISQNSEALIPFGIVFLDCGTTTSFPDLVNQQFINRSDVPVRFRRQLQRTYDVQNIVSGQGNLESSDQTTPFVTGVVPNA